MSKKNGLTKRAPDKSESARFLTSGLYSLQADLLAGNTNRWAFVSNAFSSNTKEKYNGNEMV